MKTPNAIQKEMKKLSFLMEMDGVGAAGALDQMKSSDPGQGGTTVYFSILNWLFQKCKSHLIYFNYF